MAHDGFARAIAPSHTPYDGDTIFALATGALAGHADVSRSARWPPKRRPRRSSAPSARRRASLATPPHAISRVEPLRRHSAGVLPRADGRSVSWVGRRVGTSADFLRRRAASRSRPHLLRPCSPPTSGPAPRSAPRHAGTWAASRPGGGSDPLRSDRSSSHSGSVPRCGESRRPKTCGPSATTSNFATAPTVRGVISGLLWIGSIFILAVAADRPRMDPERRGGCAQSGRAASSAAS